MKKKNFDDLLEETILIEICSDILVERNIEEEYESLSLENLERGNKIFKIKEFEKEDNEMYQLEFGSGEGSLNKVTMNDEEVFMNDGDVVLIEKPKKGKEKKWNTDTYVGEKYSKYKSSIAMLLL